MSLAFSLLFFLFPGALCAFSPPPPTLDAYGRFIETKLIDWVTIFRTILFSIVIIGLMWFIAMFVSGRPSIKPVVTVLVAAIMLGGVQVMLNTFIDVANDNATSQSPKDMLRMAP